MKIIGKSTEVTVCECCGKRDLKYTVETDEGFFGCVCAPKLLGKTHKEVEGTLAAIRAARRIGPLVRQTEAGMIRGTYGVKASIYSEVTGEPLFGYGDSGKLVIEGALL